MACSFLSAPCQLLVLAGPEHGRTIPLAKCRHFRYVIAIAGRDLGELLRLALPFSEIRGLQDNRGCCLGLILIELSSVAAAIITRMPARLSAICIASPSEMSTSAMWLASASRTPRQ